MTNTIAIKGMPFVKEGQAATVITPGDLIEIRSGTNAVGVHSTAAPTNETQRAFALENEVWSGVGPTSKGIDDTYAIGDTVKYGVFAPGQEVYAWLKNDVNANVTRGGLLMSTGDGKLTGRTGAGVEAVAVALETINNSAGGAPVRIRVEAL